MALSGIDLYISARSLIEEEMKPLPHLYEVALSGSPTDYATLSASGIPQLQSAPPRDFDGPGDAWSPEYLLVAAVEACFMFTFRAVALASKLDFLSLEISGVGTVDHKDGSTHFTDILLKPQLKVPRGTDHERARRILEKGKEACIVTASLSVPVRLEAEITDES
jgi:organic hydroperoxide reductase OsmC/OhrA